MLKKKATIPLKDQIIDAALTLASEEPWESITLNDIIEHTTLDKADILEYFDDKSDVLIAYGRRIDRILADNLSFAPDEALSTREKLFDILMERFDILNNDRDAVLSILRSFKYDPKQMVISLPHLGKSMTRAIELAGEETSGLCGATQITGLVGVYIYALKTWKDDETADLSKTMATLDKALNFAEQTANSSFSGNLMSFISDFKNR